MDIMVRAHKKRTPQPPALPSSPLSASFAAMPPPRWLSTCRQRRCPSLLFLLAEPTAPPSVLRSAARILCVPSCPSLALWLSLALWSRGLCVSLSHALVCSAETISRVYDVCMIMMINNMYIFWGLKRVSSALNRDKGCVSGKVPTFRTLGAFMTPYRLAMRSPLHQS